MEFNAVMPAHCHGLAPIHCCLVELGFELQTCVFKPFVCMQVHKHNSRPARESLFVAFACMCQVAKIL